AAETVGDAGPGHAPRILAEADNAGVGHHHRTLVTRREEGLEDQARIVRPAIPVFPGAPKTVAAKRRLGAVRRLGAQHALTPSAAQAREEIVGPQARSELPPAHGAAGIDRVDEAHRAYQMRGKAAQPLALAGGLEDEPHLALLEVAEPSVDQLRRAA